MKPILIAATIAAAAASAWAADTPERPQAPWRPAYHYTAPHNWMNDPNGLVFYKGEYHLFYQTNPFGTEDKHLSWGHAVSNDLLHWQDLPTALLEENGIQIFSGSAVVDEHNSSGLCTPKGNDAPCLIAIYAGHGHGVETQNIASSNDRGRTWRKYSGNPVIDLHLKDFRDPKVLWYEPTHWWIMIAALSDQHKIGLFGSADLIHWAHLSDFGPAGATGGVWECPDLFEIPVSGGKGTRWVLVVNINPGGVAGGSGTQYFVGKFNGEKFTDDGSSAPLWLDYGKDYYAGVSFFGNKPGDTRRIMIAWCSNWQYATKTPERGWHGMMALPRELTLYQTPEGVRVKQAPVHELTSLRTPIRTSAKTKTIASGKQLELEISYGHRSSSGAYGLRIFEGPTNFTEIGIDGAKGVLYVDRTRSGTVNFSDNFPGRQESPLPAGEPVKLHVFLDHTSIEVFANDGKVTIADRVFPSPADTRVQLFSEGDSPKVESLTVWKIGSVWK